ncbi:hypothetical protein H9Q70_013308 [Fusarium xylarioides]|nr:hypothetical protein H9Q70_013308 [Fusarium xylarioides]KAG5782194.1 hypothetical protein H9Q73_004170 [Fusarium xylarioides]
MIFSRLFTTVVLTTPGLAASLAPRAVTPWSNFNDNPLPDKSLLLSWEDYDPDVELTYFPIYKSTDGGATYNPLARVEDQVNGWGNWYQPFLYTLPQDFGGYSKGTILLAGVSTPRNLTEAYIVLYASENEGKDWEFVSRIVYGPGPETVTKGDKAVWEPFLMMHNDQLICYYSTQVDPKCNQKLSHKTTKDLRNWGAEVDDVAFPNTDKRPGMAVVAYSPVSKKYVMTFEYCGGPLTGGCPVYYKVSSDPLDFASATEQPIIPNNGGLNPNGNPRVIWTPEPGMDGKGIFIANGGSREEVFVNTDALDPNGWKPVNVGQWAAYSRDLRVIQTPDDSPAKGQPKLLITNGGNMGCDGKCYNFIADGLVDIPNYPRN